MILLITDAALRYFLKCLLLETGRSGRGGQINIIIITCYEKQNRLNVSLGISTPETNEKVDYSLKTEFIHFIDSLSKFSNSLSKNHSI